MKISEETIAALYRHFQTHPTVSTDSRRITPGSLFFALKGPSFDGNRFASAALDAGAACAVVDNSAVAARSLAGKPLDERFIVVRDVLSALQQLAAFHRRKLGIPILAITGSNGKTTTKELTARVLATRFRVSVTQGNLNNHIGVPLTLLAMDRRTEFGIVEMGASACGEIAALCEIAAPDYGLITNIGRSHLEGFGGPEGIVRGKGELYDYLERHHGLAFFRQEDPVLRGMADARPHLLSKPYATEEGDLPNHLEGSYNRMNIAAAAAVGEYFGVHGREIREAIEEYRPDNHRSQRMQTARNTLILDCYNANPSSMGAALDNFGELGSDPQLPCTAILGDMLELGEWSAAEHEAILRKLAGIHPAETLLVGREFSRAAESLPPEAKATLHTFPDREALAAWLKEHPLSGRLILVKGSHGIGLERITELL